MAEHAQTAVDLPVRWMVGIWCAALAASLSTVAAGIRLYEHLVGPARPAEAPRPPLATHTTRPVPHSGPRVAPGGPPR